MSVHSNLSSNGSTLTLVLGERFDLSTHKAFRSAYDDHSLARMHVRVDLSATRSMDSSALGMLLVLRERAGGDKANITLVGAGETVKQVLGVSRFEQLFKIG